MCDIKRRFYFPRAILLPPPLRCYDSWLVVLRGGPSVRFFILILCISILLSSSYRSRVSQRHQYDLRMCCHSGPSFTFCQPSHTFLLVVNQVCLVSGSAGKNWFVGQGEGESTPASSTMRGQQRKRGHCMWSTAYKAAPWTVWYDEPSGLSVSAGDILPPMQ